MTVVFKKLLGAFGVGGPSVDTVLSDPNVRPGATLDGRVTIRGGSNPVEIDHVTLALVTRVEMESGDSEYDATVPFHQLRVSGAFHLPSGEDRSIPFQLPVPWETPITAVFGQHLHGMTMGVRTELAVARAVDKGDLDQINVHPLPAQEAILEAFSRLGFRFKGADLERGRLRAVAQSLPFYQEIEFYAAPQYAHALNEVELTFVANPHAVEVILEVDKRGGLFTGGRDVYHQFQVPHAGGHTDWTAHIDGWFQQAVGSRGGHHTAFAPPHSGYGPGHHGHGKGVGGMGVGGMAAGVGAGLVGGYVAGEVVEEAFEDGGDFGGDAE